MRLIPGIQNVFIQKAVCKGIKEENHIIISVNIEKAFDKIQWQFIMETLQIRNLKRTSSSDKMHL